MLGLKGNQAIPGEEKGGSLLLLFLCPVVSPIKGIYYSPTHHWAGEELCDSFHIPRTGWGGKEKDGQILRPPWQRRGYLVAPQRPIAHEKWAADAETRDL